MNRASPPPVGAALSPTKAMLAGEYAVLAPGGEALTLATVPCCAVLFGPGDTYSLKGAGGKVAALPPPGTPQEQLPPDLRLPFCVLDAAAALGLPLLPPSEVGHLEIRWLARLPSEPRPQGRGLPAPSEPRPQGRGLPEDPLTSCAAWTANPSPLVPPAAVLLPWQLPALLATPLHRGPKVGSSAALCAALALALLPESQRSQALPLALAAHRRFQASGSGYDVAACFCGGASRFVHGAAQARSAPLAPHLEIQLLHTGVKASTARLLADAPRGRPTDHPALLAAHAQSSAQLTAVLCGLAPAADLPQAVAATNRTLAALDEALGHSILTPPVQAALATLTRQGFHAKVSGAGGGDFVVGFRLTPSQDATKLAP